MTVIPGDQRPLADVLTELERSQGRLDITQGGHTVAALVSAEYLESLEETIAVATDPELVAAIFEERLNSMLDRAYPLTRSKPSS